MRSSFCASAPSARRALGGRAQGGARTMMSRMIGRRPALRAVAAMAAAGAGLGRGGVARAEEQVPYSSGTERPELKAPANACDCHMHIYDSRFPVAANATWRPPDAHVDDYRRLQRRLGTTRNVVVTPSTYGTDNRCTLDALGQLGAGARGVAVVDTSVEDDELKRLADPGVRGIRFNLVQAGATTVDMLEPLARRVEPLAWHVQLHMKGDDIATIGDLLARLPAPVVFDHLGRIPQPAGEQHPAYRVIRGLLDQGRAWVKLSGAYMDSQAGPPYADATALAKAYVAAAPERLVWGSDWPHPTVTATKPDDALLFDLLA